jgi:xanthine dehydrogenase accessory factor
VTPLWASIRAALARDGQVAMATLVATRGSSPRDSGARMIVYRDSRFTGTIGGGTLEWRVLALAQAALADRAAPKAAVRRFSLGPELGQCCGGEVHVLIEVIDDAGAEIVGDLATREAAGDFTTRAVLTSAGVERTVIGEKIAPGTATLVAGVVVEGFGDDRRALHLFGAGHVGRALAMALAPLPFAVTWIDPRPDAFPAYVPANVTAIATADPAEALAAAPDGGFVLAMTHSHALDLAVVHTALMDTRFAYVGVIGSATKRARFAKRLAEAGVPAGSIVELVCPIGIGGIQGKTPAVIAAAVAAELLVRDEALRAACVPVAGLAATGG